MGRKNLPQEKAKSLRQVGLRQLQPLVAFGCFTLPLTSAYAGGLNGIPPVVLHPVQHNVSIPIAHSTVNANISNSRSPTSVQTGTKNDPSNSSTNQNGQAGNKVSHHQAGQSNHSSNSVSIGNQGNSNQTSLQTTATKTSSLPSGSYQLDLSSSNRNIVLGSNIFANTPSVTINVGGTTMTFMAGQKVTAAEYVAIQQQLATTSQSLVLNAQGAGVGGKFTLNSAVNAKVTELVVPNGVTGLDFFSKNSSLTVAGDVDNYGSIYGLSTNKLVTSGTLSATEINNESGGIISTTLPGLLATTISNTASSVSLSLNAINNISNSGAISSSGTLTLLTGHGFISNNSSGVLTANNDVNLNAGSGNLRNNGLVASNHGSINVLSAAGTDLNINAPGGTFQAANNINVREPGYNGNSNINLDGGNYLSQNLNITGGGGGVTGNVGQVTGQLNTSGNAEHFIANTPVLTLGNNALQGDPLFANNGNIVISGAVTSADTGAGPNENITIVASDNISVSPGSGSGSDAYISTQNSTNPGTNGSIILVAGAVVTPTGTSSATLPPFTSATLATVNFNNGGTGGNIDLLTNNTHAGTSGEGALLDTSSPTAATAAINGGNVILAAFANGGTGGEVLLSAGGAKNAATIDTSSVNGNGGNVTIIAGHGSAGNVVQANGPIVTGGASGNGNGGNVSVFTEQPFSSAAGNTVSFDTHGNITSGNIQPVGVLNSGTASLQAVITGGTTSVVGTSYNAGNITINAGHTTIGANLDTSATNGNGGNVFINSIDLTLAGVSTTANSAGSGGNVAIVAAGTVSTSSIATTSVNGNGGNVNIAASNFSNTGSVLTNSQVNGGNVQIVTTTGSITNTGAISTSSNTSGTGGSIVLVAASSISTGPITASGGAAGGNVVLNAGTGGLTTGAINASSTKGDGGAVVVVNGQASSNSNVVITSITTSGTFGGLVEVVNNAGNSGGVQNVSFSGAINTIGTDGNGGPVGIVSLSGAIETGNITTSASTLGGHNNPTSVSGGSVFMSSGGTNTTAININGTINTSVPTTTTADLAGNIILLSSQPAVSTVNPTNIRVLTAPVTTGGTPGTFFNYGLANASATIPTTLSIVPNNTININPGGYSTAQSPGTLVLNNPDPQMLTPINIAAVGTSITLAGITQSNLLDNINIVTAGDITTTGVITSGQATGSITLLASGNINLGGALTLASQSSMIVTAFGAAGINGNFPIVLRSQQNLVVGANINTSPSVSAVGQPVVLSANGSLYTGNINTSGAGASAAGNIALSAALNLVAGSLTTTGGANIGVAGSYVTTGTISNTGNNGGIVNLHANIGTVETGDINSPLTLQSSIPLNSVVVFAGSDIITGNITAGSATANGSGVLLSAGTNTSIGSITAGTITTTSNNNSGSVYVSATGGVTTSDINTSSSGTSNSTAGGLVTLNAGGQLTTGNINTENGAGSSGSSGAVIANGEGNITFGNISTADQSSSGNGGSVAITGANIKGESVIVGNIDTDAFASRLQGGDVYMASGGSLSAGNIAAGGSTAGQVTLSAVQAITAGNIADNSIEESKNVIIVGGNDPVQNAITIGTINTAIGNASLSNATGGSVEIVDFLGSVTTGAINTSAAIGVGNDNAQGGSIGISAGAQANGTGTITVNGITATGAVAGAGAAVGGDIYAAGAGNSGVVVNLGNVDTSGATASGIIYAGAGVIGGGSANITINTQNTTPTPITFFAAASPVNSLEGTSTVTFNGTSPPSVTQTTPTSSTFPWQPGAYSNFGGTTPLSLTLTFTIAGGEGDSRLLVPLVALGQSAPSKATILGGIDASNTTPGTFAFEGNGYNVNLFSAATNGVQIGGNIASAGSFGNPGNINIYSTGGNIWQTKAGVDISGEQLTVAANGGSIGVNNSSHPAAITPISTSITDLTAYASGGGSVYVNSTNASGLTLVDVNGATGAFAPTNPSTFQITASNGPLSTAGSTSLVEGNIVSLSGTNATASVSINSAIVFGAQQVSLQSPLQVSVGAGSIVLSPQILIETPMVVNSALIHATGTLALDNSNLANFANSNLVITQGGGSYLAETALSLSAQGNVDFGGLISTNTFLASPGENVLMIAGGNIFASAPGTGQIASINLGSSTGNGGSLTMIAGVKYTLPAIGTFNDLLISSAGFATANGGNVLLDGSANGGDSYSFTQINTSSAVANGGTVSIFATTSGANPANQPVVQLPAAGSIATGGVFANGDVNLFASGPVITPTDPAVTVGSINIVGNSPLAAGSGTIDIETGPFAIVATLIGSNFVQFHNALPTTGSFDGGSFSAITGTGAVTTGTITTQSGFLDIFAQGDVTPNFTNTGLNAQGLQLESLREVIVPVATINAQTNSVGDGGFITLNAPLINLPADVPYVLTANGIANGSGGSIVFQTSNPEVAFGTGDNAFTMQATVASLQSSGNGGSISVITPNSSITMPALSQGSSLQYGGGLNGNGGFLELSAYSIFGNTNLAANALGTGSGGELKIILSNTAPAFLDGTQQPNHFMLSANSGTGSAVSAGTIIFCTGGSLTCLGQQFVSTTANGTNTKGGTIQLIAGTNIPSPSPSAGNLLVESSFAEIGTGTGSAGTIDLESNSTTPFVVGGGGATGTNGITGSVNVQAPSGAAGDGTIIINNHGGSVINDIALTGNNIQMSSGGAGNVIVNQQLVAPLGTPNGAISLNAAGAISYNTKVYAIFGAGSITLAAGGPIGTNALSLDAPTVNVNGADGVVNLLNSHQGGQILNSGTTNLIGPFQYIGTGNITINGATPNSTLTATNNILIESSILQPGNVIGYIIVSGGVNSTSGTTTLETSGANTISGTGTAGGKTLALITGSGAIGGVGTPLNISASTLSVADTGLVVLNNTGGGGIAINFADTTSGFVLTSQSGITVNSGLASAAAIGLYAQANNGGITLNSTIGNAATSSILLSANGTGLIQQTNPVGFVTESTSLNLMGASGGVFLGFYTSNIVVTGTGVVSLGNFNFGPTTVLPSSAGTSFSLGSNGSLSLDSITANNGFLNILSDGALLQVNSAATETAKNSFILLRQANTATGDIVVLGGPTTLQTTGTGEAIEIITGTSVPSPVMGTKPSTVTVNQISGGTAFFGTNSISAPTGPVTLNLKGSNIQFSTGTRPASAIVLGPGVTITADPIGSVASPAHLNQAPAMPIGQPAALIGDTKGAASRTAPPLAFTASNFQAVVSQTSVAPSENFDTVHAAANMSSGLSLNGGLVSAVNSASIVNALGENPINTEVYERNIFRDASTGSANSGNAASITSMMGTTASTNPRESIRNYPISDNWISDTELVTGEIPAILNSDEEFGINSDVSMVVELREGDHAADATPVMNRGLPLSGSVSRIVRGAREVTLNKGSVVFVPSQATIVHTSFGDVKIDARSVVLVMAFQHGLAVFDLHDTHGKAVHVVAGGKELVLAPGTQVTITSNRVKSFDEINPAQVIAYGRLRDRSLSQGLKAFTSEFSISQSLAVLLPIKQLVNSKHVHAQKLSAHLLKTAAILNQMHNGNYEQIKRQELTAYTQP